MKSSERHSWSAIAILVVLVFVFQLSTISHQSYFMDEVEELRFAKGDFWESVFMPDSMPPLFTVSLRSWLTVFGDYLDPRWMSAVWGLLATFAVYVFVRSITSARVGLVTASLFACCPLQLYYSQLIRGYALMIFLSVCCIGFFVLAMKDTKPRYLAAFTAFSVIGMYGHYYFAMIPITLLIAWLRQARRDQLFRIAICYSLMFVLTCPVLVFLVEDFKYQHNLRDPRPLSLSAVVYTYFSYFSGYALGPSQRELQYIGSGPAIRMAIPWLLALATLSLPLIFRGMRAMKQTGLWVTALLLLTVPLILIGTAGHLAGITYNVRFVAWFAFPISMLIGFAFLDESGRRLPKWSIVCCTALFGVLLVANYNRLFNPRYQIEDARGVSEYLLKNGASGDPIYVVSDYMLQPLAHYYGGQQGTLLELPQPGVRSRVINDAVVLAEAMGVVDSSSGGKRSWLVYSRPFHGDPQGLLLNEFIKRGATLKHRFAGIDLYMAEASETLSKSAQ